MDRTTELAVIDEIADLLARGSTAMAPDVAHVPFTDLVGSERLRAERAVLFREYPLVIAPGSAVPEVGDFITEDMAGLPLLVVRGRDEQVRVFLNICRHRGNRLCGEKSGNRRVFSCQYHAWTYTREGACRSVVDGDGFAGLDREDYGLIEYPAQERHGLIWMLPQRGGALDVAGYLGEDLDAELSGYLQHTRHAFRSTHFEQPFNWKFGVNTFQELFHLAFLHKDSLGKSFISNLSSFRSYAPHQRITVVRSTFPDMLTLPEAERSLFPHCTIVYALFPNVILTWQLDHVELWRFTPSPSSDDTCDVGLWLLTHQVPQTDKAQQHWERNWDIVSRTVFDEDFATMSNIQRNIRTGLLDEIVYGRNEIGLQDYHAQITGALRRYETPLVG
ncbi:MAG: Rieske 2Fe-2S domain-containing protein [Pseudonocardiaceae bacterium]|nr:Rieske 2Fe-2S domain-containing protein [Pseudonocardiaceae bacterium]